MAVDIRKEWIPETEKSDRTERYYMTKEVELTIKGIQKYDSHEDSDLETKVTGEYYYRNNCHYVLYEEETEGFSQPTKSMLKLKDGVLEMTRKGLINTTMVFDRRKETACNYRTPFGELLLGIRTKGFYVLETENLIRADVEYSLDAQEEHMADCRIKIQIAAK